MGEYKLRGLNVASASTIGGLTASAVTVTSGTIYAPDGGAAALMLESNTAARHAVYASRSGAQHAVSALMVSVKAHVHSYSANRYLALGVSGGSIAGTDRFGAIFDVSSGAVLSTGQNALGDVSASGIVDLGSGWFDCWVAGSMLGTTAAIAFGWAGVTSASTGASVPPSFTGTGSDGVYLYEFDLSNAVLMNPDYDLKRDGRKVENVHRTRSGKQYRYTWGRYDRVKFKVEDLTSAQACQVNSYWQNNAELRLLDTENSCVISGYLVNGSSPIDQYMKPYVDQFKGTIELEGY